MAKDYMPKKFKLYNRSSTHTGFIWRKKPVCTTPTTTIDTVGTPGLKFQNEKLAFRTCWHFMGKRMESQNNRQPHPMLLSLALPVHSLQAPYRGRSEPLANLPHSLGISSVLQEYRVSKRLVPRGGSPASWRVISRPWLETHLAVSTDKHFLRKVHLHGVGL